MELTVTEESAVTRLVLSGRMDLDGVQAIESRLTELTAGKGQTSILDCSGVTFIGSLGVGILFKLARALRAKHARLILLAPKPAIQKVLETAYVTELIDLAPDEAAALKKAGVDDRGKPQR